MTEAQVVTAICAIAAMIFGFLVNLLTMQSKFASKAEHEAAILGKNEEIKALEATIAHHAQEFISKTSCGAIRKDCCNARDVSRADRDRRVGSIEAVLARQGEDLTAIRVMLGAVCARMDIKTTA